MNTPRTATLLVVIAHWIFAMGHLFVAAQVVPAPNNHVSWLAIALISAAHWIVSVALWTLNDRLSGPLTLIFFFAALGGDLYEHLLHASFNNVFMVAPGSWTSQFNSSVLVLLALEIMGCSLGIQSIGGWRRQMAA